MADKESEKGDQKGSTEPPKRRVMRVMDIDFAENHHMAQLDYERKHECPVHTLGELARVLSADAPRRPYQRPPNTERSVNHWGQRKLLLSEIEFLTVFGQKGTLVVYAGAAPGTHTNYLADLFPSMDFLLVDPSEFYAKPTNRIEIRQEFFTEQICREVREGGRDVLFISDIRTADPKVLDAKAVEKAVAEDMTLQMNWHNELQPRVSMLKFRLPWEKGVTDYLDGDIYLPVWGRETTTECRLMVHRGAKVRKYDNTQYEEQMFFFNREARVHFYEHAYVGKVVGLDHCYDCAAEIFILEDYLRSTHAENNPNCALHGSKSLSEAVVAMSLEMNGHCSREESAPRTLRYHETAVQRKQWFQPKTFDYDKREMRPAFLGARGGGFSGGGGRGGYGGPRPKEGVVINQATVRAMGLFEDEPNKEKNDRRQEDDVDPFERPSNRRRNREHASDRGSDRDRDRERDREHDRDRRDRDRERPRSPRRSDHDDSRRGEKRRREADEDLPRTDKPDIDEETKAKREARQQKFATPTKPDEDRATKRARTGEEPQ